MKGWVHQSWSIVHPFVQRQASVNLSTHISSPTIRQYSSDAGRETNGLPYAGSRWKGGHAAGEHDCGYSANDAAH